MYGRRYRLVSSPDGTHAWSVETSATSEPRKSSAGSSGSASRRAERANRAAFACGLKLQIEPSACRYALRPSKISCP